MAAPWWKSSVVYQVYPRSFADSDGDGVGDLPGLIDRLDHIAALGADVLWVSPFYPSPQADNGYDVSDYQGVDPRFGTLADVDRLLAEVHARGMKLVIDIVANHTSDEHPWFLESRSSRDNPKRDWYWWRPPRPGKPFGSPGAEPTSWRSFFYGPAWAPDEPTGDYYLHLFHRKQPDLNWENSAVREAIHAMLRWWLDRGVDGFRFDVVNLLSKHFDADGVGHYVDGPRIHDYLHEMHEQVWAGREPVLFTVGETPGVSVEQARLYTDPARREVDMVFQFEHMHVDHGPGGRFDPRPLDLVALKRVMARWQEGLAQAGWNALYWGNHDQPRPVSRFGCDAPAHRADAAKALATALHLHRGTPYVYQGEELGMTNYPFTALDELDDVESRGWVHAALQEGRDPAEVLAAVNRQSRDHPRTPMQWDAGPHAGFTTGRPWLPVNPNHREVNVAAQVGDPDSVFTHFRRLIRLRRQYPVVVDGDFTLLLPEHPTCYAFLRRLPGDELLVLANWSCEPAEVDVPPGWEDSDVVLSSGPASPVDVPHRWEGSDVVLSSGAASPAAPVGHLGPWEARVHRRVAG